MISADDIIEALESQKTIIKEQDGKLRLFAAYVELAANKGALDQECDAVIQAKNFLKRR
jgi:hypothetical protein